MERKSEDSFVSPASEIRAEDSFVSPVSEIRAEESFVSPASETPTAASFEKAVNETQEETFAKTVSETKVADMCGMRSSDELFENPENVSHHHHHQPVVQSGRTVSEVRKQAEDSFERPVSVKLGRTDDLFEKTVNVRTTGESSFVKETISEFEMSSDDLYGTRAGDLFERMLVRAEYEMMSEGFPVRTPEIGKSLDDSSRTKTSVRTPDDLSHYRGRMESEMKQSDLFEKLRGAGWREWFWLRGTQFPGSESWTR